MGAILPTTFGQHFLAIKYFLVRASLVAQTVKKKKKKSACNARDPSQYSCLENPMDRGAWQATVHGVTKELGTI